MLEALLVDGSPARAGGRRCHLHVERHPFRIDFTSIRRTLDGLAAGDSIIYAVPLDTPALVRLVTSVTLSVRLALVRRSFARAGVRVAATCGLDPSLDAPMCVYELNTAAAAYADRCLRPRGSAQAIRRAFVRWFNCDPALGAIVVVGVKS